MSEKNSIKTSDRNMLFIKTVVLILIPFAACFCIALFQGKNVLNIYLPNSEFNDELLYFKQIEAILKFGFPKGYFGYNESTARVLTFSAWSPIIIYPFALIGKIISFGYFAPYLINSVFMAIAFMVFALVYRPKWNEIAGLAGIFILFVPVSRLIMSIMSDIEIIALCVVFMALYLKAEKLNKTQEIISNGHITAMFIIAAVLSVMRPYFLLFLFFPSLYAARKNKKSIFVSIGVLIITVTAYVVLSGFFTAAYYFPLISTDWIKAILASPISGTRQALSIFAYGCRMILKCFPGGITTGGMIASLWILYVVLTAVTVVASFFDRKKWAWSLILIVFAIAVIMFYDINVGSRHLIPFIVMIIILFVTDEKHGRYFSYMAMLLILLLFTIRMNEDAYNYILPDENEALAAEIETVKEQSVDMLTGDADNRWDNTVIWVWRDEDVTIHWNELYGLPAGIGINMCTPEFVKENWGKLKSKYIASTPDGFVAELCEKDNAELIVQTDRVCIWKIR